MEWSNNRRITATYQDKSDILYCSIQDLQGNIIIDWNTKIKENGEFVFNFLLALEAQTDQKFKLVCKDKYENQTEREIVIEKTDSLAPQMISKNSYTEDWTKYKQIEVIATDNGIGQVQISFNDETNYALADVEGKRYNRSFRVTGDVYEEQTRAIYLKDGLGNSTANKIVIHKIDNTSPTITKVLKKEENGKITVIVEANDRNEKLEKEGSGIIGYRISRKEEVPGERTFQTSNQFRNLEKGIYYLYVKDKVGNISKIEKVEI